MKSALQTLVPVVNVEVTDGIKDHCGLGDCRKAHVLVRLEGAPLCRLEVPVIDGVLRGWDVWNRVFCPANNGPSKGVIASIMDKLFPGTQVPTTALPGCSIVICTRNRPEDVQRCLEALAPTLGPDVEMIVVDNDPTTDATARIAGRFPVAYFRQERRGVNWARARGAMLARHEIVLYADDDVVVDRNWVHEMRKPFADPHVGAVTGAVEPLELTTEGQYLNELYGSFYRGFNRRVHNLLTSSPAAAGHVGAGASMGVRRSLALKYKIFEAELDGGTAARSGGDVFGFYRILRAGYSIVFAPRALAWHRHRKSYEDLERTVQGYSLGGYCVLWRVLLVDRDLDAVFIGLYWFYEHHLTELWKTVTRKPGARPWSLISAEIRGVLYSPIAYLRCRRRERMLGALFENTSMQKI